ncbi:MAG TPA: nucleoside 2-deoxyribosyltransferase [Flavisolibacter sp.]|nr:nucleoside 2-deoxyribosyltransferase [Flavisolibacter sp.]
MEEDDNSFKPYVLKAYISLSYHKRQDLEQEVRTIKETLLGFAILPFVFVDNYHFHPSEERQMMQQALQDIDDCDILLAETSDKGIGIGIEAGFAKAKNKPVIYMRQKKAAHSTTVSGISDFQIVYESSNDLQKQLSAVLEQIRNTP